MVNHRGGAIPLLNSFYMATKNSITGDEIKSKALSAKGRANWDKIFAKKTALAWAKEDNIFIMDADGFNWQDGITVDSLISYSEYSKRIGHCTILFQPNK
jgi:hypothetical protein